MINFKNAKYIKSTPDYSHAPKDFLPEVVLLGKSNVGKSSLINALTNQKSLAYVSSKPGRTRLLNYFLIDDKFYLLDAPGYGYAKGNIDLDLLFKTMMEDYFKHTQSLKLVFILLDSRRELSHDDVDLINYMEENSLPYYLIFTKKDKINQKETAQLLKHLTELKIKKEEIHFVSVNDNASIANLSKLIEKSL